MIRRVITYAILGSLLLLNSMALPQVVMHSMHHDDRHSSATHNSPICFWVCTAGQMEDASDIPPNPIARIIDFIHAQLFLPQSATSVSHQYARGPPASILSTSFFVRP